MRERMGKEDRRDQLSHIMLARYTKSQSQADFTAASLASEAGISTVWFYALAGKQFMKLRAKLPGPIPSGETLVTRLRKEIAGLRTQLKDLKAKYESSIKEKLAEAIRHIELLDKENRMLRENVTALEKRLSDSKLVIFIEAHKDTIVPSKNQI
jgi:hypothetical protein